MRGNRVRYISAMYLSVPFKIVHNGPVHKRCSTKSKLPDFSIFSVTVRYFKQLSEANNNLQSMTKFIAKRQNLRENNISYVPCWPLLRRP